MSVLCSFLPHVAQEKSTISPHFLHRTNRRRLLEYCKAVAERDMKKQLLDSMDLERERGITIKLNAARIEYPADDGITYILNLIDTPGHVDFSYEVSVGSYPEREQNVVAFVGYLRRAAFSDCFGPPAHVLHILAQLLDEYVVGDSTGRERSTNSRLPTSCL